MVPRLSTLVPNDDRIALAEGLALDILPEERAPPIMARQKLSASFAADVSGVGEPAILLP